jgi:predicted nucleotidyltransferase
LLNFEGVDVRQFDLARTVVEELLELGDLEPANLMIVGASCRDILHAGLGHEFGLRATTDVDVAIALPAWAPFERLTQQLQPAGDNGIRYLVRTVKVDLLPFGEVEDPVGTVTPARREAEMNVFAFSEVFDGSLRLPLGPGFEVRIPDIPGYCALKMSAWANRCLGYDFRDGADIAAALYWYAEADAVGSRLYDTDEGRAILVATDLDRLLASAELLGRDVAAKIGPERTGELEDRWPALVRGRLVGELGHQTIPGWTSDLRRREAVIERLCAGLWG